MKQRLGALKLRKNNKLVFDTNGTHVFLTEFETRMFLRAHWKYTVGLKDRLVEFLMSIEPSRIIKKRWVVDFS